MRRKDREVTSREDIAEILDSCKTACIAMIDGDSPYVIPLSYGYDLDPDGLVLYFHCAKEGRKTDILKTNDRVCFTVFNEGEPVHSETPCNSGYYYSSVVGNGNVKFIEDIDEKKYALKKMFERQTGKDVDFTDGQADTVCVFKILSVDYTGKRKPNTAAKKS